MYSMTLYNNYSILGLEESKRFNEKYGTDSLLESGLRDVVMVMNGCKRGHLFHSTNVSVQGGTPSGTALASARGSSALAISASSPSLRPRSTPSRMLFSAAITRVCRSQ